MPKTARQQRAAGAELTRRRKGIKKLKSGTASRPLGDVSVANLRDLATKPKRKGSKRRG